MQRKDWKVTELFCGAQFEKFWIRTWKEMIKEFLLFFKPHCFFLFYGNNINLRKSTTEPRPLISKPSRLQRICMTSQENLQQLVKITTKYLRISLLVCIIYYLFLLIIRYYNMTMITKLLFQISLSYLYTFLYTKGKNIYE